MTLETIHAIVTFDAQQHTTIWKHLDIMFVYTIL